MLFHGKAHVLYLQWLAKIPLARNCLNSICTYIRTYIQVVATLSDTFVVPSIHSLYVHTYIQPHTPYMQLQLCLPSVPSKPSQNPLLLYAPLLSLLHTFPLNYCLQVPVRLIIIQSVSSDPLTWLSFCGLLSLLHLQFHFHKGK